MSTRAFVLAGLLMVLVPAAALAYPGEAILPEGVERTECIHCHGTSETELLVPGEDTPVRKGPHGGYTLTTSRCQTCHTLHDAPVADGVALLPGKTIKNVCESCHDGTGGAAVYGVIKARTGVDVSVPGVGSSHRIETEGNNVVPGGSVQTGAMTVEFSGPGGQLTCSDCHSPHDSDTVEPFVGDRLRAEVASDAAAAVPTNRLLRRAPTGAQEPVDVYGAGWCAGCHQERAVRHAEGAGAAREHPVAQDDTYHYASLPVVSGPGSIDTVLGGLGRSNRGYVMPGPVLEEPTLKTPLQEAGTGPICQQCHEDSRDVGPSERWTDPVLGEDQEFRVTAYGQDADPYDNPRFQVFPHESDAPSFLVRAPEPEEPASLCLNCHSLLHEASTVQTGDFVFFAANQHDDAQPNEPYVVGQARCTLCHTTDLLAAHGDRCTLCHVEPYDSLGTWTRGCSQGGCHAQFHLRSPEAHDPWAGSGADCDLCHIGGSTADDRTCHNCHALFVPGDTTPPVTFSDAQPLYEGAALIRFSVTKQVSGQPKVAVGTTYFRLDGGETSIGRTVLVTEPGEHTVEFWSVDQNGNVEDTVKVATFTVIEDITPPVTTAVTGGSDLYDGREVFDVTGSGVPIRLDATDASALGVKTTYYRLDGGSVNEIQPGGGFVIPSVTGTVSRTLEYWSSDWSGNVEAPNVVTFTVVKGTGTIRLVWGGPVPGGASAEWTVRLGSSGGAIVVQGQSSGPGWDGVDDIVLPVREQSYHVEGWWYDPGIGWDEPMVFLEGTPLVSLRVPGEVAVRTY